MPISVLRIEDDISIGRENFQECLDALQALHRTQVPGILCPGGPVCHTASTLEEKLSAALDFFGWPMYLDKDGLYSLQISNRPHTDCDPPLHAIAPCVRPQSRIRYVQEDGSTVQYFFNGATMKKSTGTIAWENG